MKKEKDISIIIPIYNEEDSINELYGRLSESVSKITKNYELIFVNDGSKDSSYNELVKLSRKDKNVFYINFSRNFGHQIAVSAGLKYSNAKATVIIDGDLQDPPELIPEMYDKYKEGFEVVYAKRRHRDGETFLKKKTAKLFYLTLEKITSFKIPLDVGDFRLIDKKVVAALNNMPEQNKFIRGQVAWLGFNQTHVFFDRASRKYGKTNYRYKDMIELALDAITSFSNKPIVLVTRLGFFISLLAFFLILYSLFVHLILDRTITGWTSLIISSLFIGGVQLLSIGIIGEYIGRINKNINNRPLFVIQNSNLELNSQD